MKKIKVADNIYQYHFTDSISDFSNTITIVLTGSTAIFFDVAYKRHVEKVMKDLTGSGVADYIVFLSHHHEDHFGGAECFDRRIVYGAVNFPDDPQEHLDTEFMKNYIPGNNLVENEEYNINGILVKAIYTPGHNKCHYVFLINHKMLFAGDLVYYDKSGKPCVPYIDENSTAQEHLDSLHKIRELDADIMLVGHGKHIVGRDDIIEEINKRILYLEKLIQSQGSLSVEECLPVRSTEFSGLIFHEMNRKRIMKK